MPELTPQHWAILERLRAQGFRLVAFPMYAKCVGVKRGNCGALLVPVVDQGFKILGEPAYLVSGNLSVRVTRGGRGWFVWKQESLEASPPRIAELEQFAKDLSTLLPPVS